MFITLIIIPCRSFALTHSDEGVITLESKWQVHDMHVLGKNIFQVAGDDPFVFSDPLPETHTKNKGFFLRIALSPKVAEHKLQCYWETAGMPFSEVNSFHFVLRGNQEQYQVFLPLYFFDTLKHIQRIRFDLDPKTDSLLTIVSFGVVHRVSSPLLAFIPEDLDMLIQDSSVILSPPVVPRQPGKLHIDETWALHDIEQADDGRLRITGKDPYLESPALDLDVSLVQGVYLRILSNNSSAPCKMQFFWKSYLLDYPVERRSFNEKDSYWFWMEFNRGFGEVYLPLNVADPENYIKAIRLDFASCQNMEFTIQQIAFVGNESSKLLSHLPRQIAYKNMAAIPETGKSGEYVVKWRKNIFLDRVFWEVYLTLLIGVFLALCVLGYWKRGCKGV
jgi:hypothetical protein